MCVYKVDNNNITKTSSWWKQHSWWCDWFV